MVCIEMARWQTGKGANHTLFGGAFKACAAGGQTGGGCLFRPPFLWFISFGGAKEMNIIQINKIIFKHTKWDYSFFAKLTR